MTDHQERPTPDVTRSTTDHLMAMEEELVRLRRELDHTHRLSTIGTITAGVAHEINNLLTPALAYTQRAMSDPERSDFLLKAVTQTSESLGAATQILQAILGFASARDDRPAAELEIVVDAALDCLGRDLSRDGIQLQRDIPTGTTVAMSPLALQQTVLNLILNARRALRGRNGGEISIEARPDADGLVSISVRDNGPGIPDEIRQTLFEPFVSVAPTGAESGYSGTGLGLAVCRRAVESAGGDISAVATPGGGATIVICLPVVAAIARDQADEAA